MGSMAPVPQWTIQSDAPVPLAPDLVETVWKTAVAPFGPYDFIGLHRLRAPAVSPAGGVIVFLPGETANGVLYTTDESADFRVYLARRGYDVYSLDYRSHFIPPLGLGRDLKPLDLSSLNVWDGNHFVSDLHLAVQLAKQTSGVSTVYLAAFSSGNEFMYAYAALVGREELRGLIGMDGGPWQTGSAAAPRTVDFEHGRAALLGGDTAANRTLLEAWNVTPGPGPQFAAGDLSGDLAKVKLGKHDPDLLANLLQNLWGDGQLTNIEKGYNSLERLLPFLLQATDDFWPNIQTLEDVTTSNWDGKPPTLHYLDRFAAVDLPMILFASGKLTNFDYTQEKWKLLAPTLCRTTDASTYTLDGFGHLDVLTGTFARERVFEPIETWLRAH